MYNIFLIPSSINWYLGYFHVVHGIIRVGHDLGTKQWELNVCHCKEHYDQHLATIIIFRPGFLPDICQGVRLMDHSVQFSSVLNRVGLFATPWTAACQASLSITNSRSSLKLTSIESVMPSSHLILCRPLYHLPPIPPSIRVFSNESALCIRWPKYWSLSFNISPSNEHRGLIPFRMDLLDLPAVQGTLQSSPTPQFKSINSSVLSLLHSPTLTSIPDYWRNHCLDCCCYCC